MAIEAVKVPADIQVEEKIIGPIGLRQIFILIGTGGLSYVFWTITKNAGMNATFQILAWIPLVVGLAFSFVKVHDVSLLRLILLMIERMQKPPRRAFGPRAGITIAIRTNGPEEKKVVHSKAPEAQEKIKELSAILDTKMHEAAGEEIQAIADVDGSEPEYAETDTIQISASEAEDSPRVDGLHAEEKANPPKHDTGIFHDITPPSAA